MPPATSNFKQWLLRRRTFPRRFFLWLSIFCLLIASSVYWCQPDLLAGMSLVPAWCWLVAGLVSAGLGFTRARKWQAIAVACLWLMFSLVFVEEIWSLGRGLLPLAVPAPGSQESKHVVRVVSFNCYTLPKAATEVVQLDPDIVFFQEAPSRKHVRQVAEDLFGNEADFLWSPDTSIVARGTLREIVSGRSSHFVLAELTTRDAANMHVASLRLSPPSFRADFWSLGCWSDHSAVRAEHRQQILNVLQAVDELPASTPLIVGGDFNSVPDDAALRPLEPRLADTFRAAGRGWGNTGTNSYPLWRVDQIWASDQFDVRQTFAQTSIRSDHRMVVCDLILRD